MPNVARTTPEPRHQGSGHPGAPTAPDGLPDVLLDVVRSARDGADELPGLAPDTYARDHAVFEELSDQRGLIADHVARRLARLGDGPFAVLSVGCGDGSLDSRLAAGLLDAVPGRAVTYVGVDPFAGSAAAFAEAMATLDRPGLSARVHHATFADVDLGEAAGTFDAVVAVHSLYYVADVAATLRRAHALLRPGGELVVVHAPQAALNALVGVLAPPLEGHRQWFSHDVADGFVEAGLEVLPVETLDALVDLAAGGDDVLDFAVQARLTPELRVLVRDYLDAVSVLDDAGEPRVPHPVDVLVARRP